MGTPDRLDTDDLVRHAAGVRALAGRLVRGEEADDLAQDALLRGMQRPPRDGYAPGGWLRGLVRNISRERRRARERRVRRERGWRPDGGEDDVACTAQRTEDQLRLAEAVNRLPEMYRAVVWLRYFGDRSPSEIATLLGEPPATVRTRLRRAMARLRDDLDTAYGGRRRQWQAAFLPLAGLSSLGKGATVASNTHRGITVTVLVLLAAGGGAWWIAGDAHQGTVDGDPPMRTDADALPGGAPALEGTGHPEGAALANDERRGRPLQVTVVDLETGKPVAGARVWVGHELAPGILIDADAPRQQVTDARGALELLVRSPGKLVAKAYADGYLQPTEPTAVAEVEGAAPSFSVRVPLSRGDVLHGQVLLPSGAKPSGPVEVKLAQFRKGTSGPAYGSSVTTDETGAFVAGGLRRCSMRLTTLHTESGRRFFGRTTTRSDAGHVELLLREPNPGDAVSFLVKFRDTEGKPVGATRMRLIVKNGGRHFRHDCVDPLEGEMVFEIEYDPGAELWLEAVGVGSEGEAITRGPIPATTAEVTLVSGAPTQISGVVTDARGAGLSGVRLAARYLFPFQPKTQSIGDVHGRATSRADGTFALPGLAQGRYRLELEVPEGHGHPGELEVESGTAGVRIALEAGWRGAFEVVDGAGVGVPGAKVIAYHRRDGPLPDRMHPSMWEWYYYVAARSTTDEAGRAALGGLRAGATYHLIVEAPRLLRLAPVERPEWSPQPTTITLARRGTITGTVRYPDGTPASGGQISWWREGSNTYHTTGVQEDGRFWIRNVEEGAWVLRATSPTGNASEETVGQIGDMQVALVVPKPAKRWLRIKDWRLEDAGAAGRLAAYAGAQRVGWTSIHVEGDGRVDLTRYPTADRASLWLGGLADGRFVWAERVELPEAGERIVQAVQGATLEGSVTLPTGVTLDELVIEVDAPLRDPQARLPMGDIAVRADAATGRFEVPGVPERKTAVRATGFAEGVRYVGETEAAPGDDVQITLGPAR